MSTLIRNVKIADKASKYNGRNVDILVERNQISKIAKGLKEKAGTEIDGKGAYLSPGWVDVFAGYGEPGEEYKETIQSGLNAAQSGGFSEVLMLPNTSPAISNASILSSVQQRAKGHPVALHIYGAVSKNLEGKDLAEMLDMHHEGAIAYTDGWMPVQNAQLLLKALEYVKAFDGLIVQVPIQEQLSAGGLMHEGKESVRLGMQGIPGIAESLLIKRDIELLRYTQSRIHFSGISTKASVALIKAAKKEGLAVTCSVTPYHLLFNDKVLENYESNFKLNPPLRTEEDRKALIKGLKEGVIDCIASHHHPQDWDAKHKEFNLAGWGQITQETTWSMLLQAIPDLAMEEWVSLLSTQARQIFRLPALSIEVGANARFTLFDHTTKWRYQSPHKQSLGINSPFLNQELSGKAQFIQG